MRILTSITLTDEQVKAIGWDCGNYAEDTTDEVEVKDWLDATLRDTIEDLPLPPDNT